MYVGHMQWLRTELIDFTSLAFRQGSCQTKQIFILGRKFLKRPNLLGKWICLPLSSLFTQFRRFAERQVDRHGTVVRDRFRQAIVQIAEGAGVVWREKVGSLDGARVV
jgi:hypothetical protein